MQMKQSLTEWKKETKKGVHMGAKLRVVQKSYKDGKKTFEQKVGKHNEFTCKKLGNKMSSSNNAPVFALWVRSLKFGRRTP